MLLLAIIFSQSNIRDIDVENKTAKDMNYVLKF